MWTPQNRKRYDRSRLRYPSDLMDEEWAHVAAMIPPAKPGGNKRTVDVREVMNGVMYVLSTGCQWRALPKDLPPKSTVHDYLILWSCCRVPRAGRTRSEPDRCHHRQPERERRRKRGACLGASAAWRAALSRARSATFGSG